MSAETLRAAARLMRERARAATGSPWKSGLTGIYGGGDEFYIAKWDDDSGTPVVGDRMHIASWHPAVALAVADWLDAEAEAVDFQVSVTPAYRMRDNDEALVVARAYLGEAQP